MYNSQNAGKRHWSRYSCKLVSIGRSSGRGSGSSRFEAMGRSPRSAMQRLKSGKGTAVRDFVRTLMMTSGLYRAGLNWYLTR